MDKFMDKNCVGTPDMVSENTTKRPIKNAVKANKIKGMPINTASPKKISCRIRTFTKNPYSPTVY